MGATKPDPSDPLTPGPLTGEAFGGEGGGQKSWGHNTTSAPPRATLDRVHPGRGMWKRGDWPNVFPPKHLGRTLRPSLSRTQLSLCEGTGGGEKEGDGQRGWWEGSGFHRGKTIHPPVWLDPARARKMWEGPNVGLRFLFVPPRRRAGTVSTALDRARSLLDTWTSFAKITCYSGKVGGGTSTPPPWVRCEGPPRVSRALGWSPPGPPLLLSASWGGSYAHRTPPLFFDYPDPDHKARGGVAHLTGK